MKKIVVIKLGTNAILDGNGDVDNIVLKNLAKGVFELREQGFDVVIVSSGAVAAARSEFDSQKIKQISKTELTQIRSAVGQPRLMKQFRHIFKNYNIPVAQGLVTRSDFADRSRQLSMRNIIHKMLSGGILPIMNENDFLTPEELDFSDNDQLAGFIAGMLQADKLIILSNVSGLFSCHPESPGAQKIDVVSEITPEIEQCVSQKRSTHGLGGMQSKIDTARVLSQLGIEMVLAGSREEDILQKIFREEPVGTHFVTSRTKKQSGIRVWLASGASTKGRIFLNCPLEKIFHNKKTGVSLLGVGIRMVKGDFHAGDAIDIISEKGGSVGRGVAKISSQEMKLILQSDDIRGKVFVHADSLFLH